jgi:Tfp pilus assembly protein PilX
VPALLVFLTVAVFIVIVLVALFTLTAAVSALLQEDFTEDLGDAIPHARKASKD